MKFTIAILFSLIAFAAALPHIDVNSVIEMESIRGSAQDPFITLRDPNEIAKNLKDIPVTGSKPQSPFITLRDPNEIDKNLKDIPVTGNKGKHDKPSK